MSYTEVKYEFECDSRLQCRVCLSVGRKLAPLGRLTKIFMKLTSDLHHFNLIGTPIEICWECKTLLRKVLLFQEQVKKAHDLLLNGQNFIYGPLSNLASITLNDTHHTIYLNNTTQTNLIENGHQINTDKLKTQKKIPSNEQSLLNNVNKSNKNQKYRKKVTLGEMKTKEHRLKSDDFTDKQNLCYIQNNAIFDSNENIQLKTKENYVCTNTVPFSEMFTIIMCDKNNEQNMNVNKTIIPNENSGDDLENSNGTEATIEKESKVNTKLKNKYKSRWAMKRAEQNKKPKFKIVSTNLDETFIKIRISNEELVECLERERDSECYKSKRFKCELCILGFTNEINLRKHNRLLHTETLGRYICDICKTNIDDKCHLLGHITQHYLVHKCTICEFVCRNEEQRSYHLQKEHKNMFQCLKCDLKFCNRRYFFMHFKEWHEKFVCDHCGISFKMRYCIKDHIRKQHSPFTCVPCNKTFARYNGLWLHKKLAHSPAASPAYCVECDISYKDIYRYKWHLCNSVKHTPKKKLRVPCPDCEKTFTKKIYMRDHYNLVHLKLFRYRCQQCDKNFIRNAELVKHRLRTHEGILPPRNKICYLCGRGFTTNKILSNHVRTHTGERTQAGAAPTDTFENKICAPS